MISLDESVFYPTTQTSRNIIRLLFCYLKQFDITPEQWTIMKHISRHDGVTPKELSLITDKDKATVTRILDVLERKELISKLSNLEDRRSVLLYITETGKKQVEELGPYIEQLFEQIALANISAENLEIYKQVLNQMNDNILKNLEFNE